MSVTDKFIDYLKAQVGSVYVWGGQGEPVSEEFIKKHETSERNAERALAFYRKRLEEGASNLKAYDCSGLIMKFMLEEGLLPYDMSSRGIYSMCAKIDRQNLIRGDLVFRHDGERIYHVGVYIGDGRVIESKGRDYGVIEAGIDRWGTGYWNRFGRLQLACGGRDLELLNPRMKGNDVALMQEQLMSLGYDLGKWGADGIFGPKTDEAVRIFKARASGIMPDGRCDAVMRQLIGMEE